MIDPTGAGTITDSAGPGGGERTTLHGEVGQYLVVVRGHVASTGRFELAANQVTSTTLSLDEAVEGEIESADVPASFVIDVPASSDVGVMVMPRAISMRCSGSTIRAAPVPRSTPPVSAGWSWRI